MPITSQARACVCRRAPHPPIALVIRALIRVCFAASHPRPGPIALQGNANRCVHAYNLRGGPDLYLCGGYGLPHGPGLFVWRQ
jgi:hypothetical protein